MGRPKSNAKLVEFLNAAIKEAEEFKSRAAKAEKYVDAETFKGFKEVLVRALELCGEGKPIE